MKELIYPAIRGCLSLSLIILGGALQSFSTEFPPHGMALLSCCQQEITSATIEDAEAKAISHLETSLAQQKVFLNRQELWKIYGYSMGEGGIGERIARPGKERQILMYAAMLRALLMPSPHSADIFPQVPIFGIWLNGISCRSEPANIHVKQSYSAENSFKEYLTGLTKPVFQNEHALHFFSKRKIGWGTGLVVPRKGYVSIYSFSKQATEEEIYAFWKLIYQVYKKGRPDGKPWQGFGFHSGSRYGQTVAHVHSRLES